MLISIYEINIFTENDGFEFNINLERERVNQSGLIITIDNRKQTMSEWLDFTTLGFRVVAS